MLDFDLKFKHDDTQVALFDQSVVRDVANSYSLGGAALDSVAATAGLIYLKEVLEYVPVLTGTLFAAQQVIVHEGHGEALIYTANVINPVFGGDAADYVFDVVSYDPFYDEAVASIPEDFLQQEIETVLVESLEAFSFV